MSMRLTNIQCKMRMTPSTDQRYALQMNNKRLEIVPLRTPPLTTIWLNRPRLDIAYSLSRLYMPTEFL